MDATPTRPPPRRRWWRRLIPARVRQQAPLIALSTVVLALVGWLLGSVQIRPYVFSSEVLEPPSITHDVQGEVELFDRSREHTIEISVSEVEYDKMVGDYQASGDKTWIRADVVIDGTRLESVGIRLKGNSTLMSLRGHRGRPGGGPGGPNPEGAPSPAAGMPTGAAGGPGPMSTASFDDPSSLPFLLAFDEFVIGRGYQGRTRLALRPTTGGGSNLNEALALQLIAESGQISQRFTWVRLRVNGGEAVTRLVVEDPDQNYAVSLGKGAGALYKSRSTNEFSYKGEDATAYVDDFSQRSAVGTLDLAPVIGLLRFLDEASDAEFDTELGKWVDVASFARYVATHELLNNFDDMSGPGRNFLLWYDAGDDQFTIVSWDMNLAISGMDMRSPGNAAPEGEGEFGRPRGPPRGGRPSGSGPGGAMRVGNTLKERFTKSAAFADVIRHARADLAAQWFESGRALALVDELAGSVPTTSTLDANQLRDHASTLASQIEQLQPAASTSP